MHKGEQILSESEIGLLGIGLDFAPIQQKINEPELRRDFQEFCRRIKIKWNFSGFPSLKVESAWKAPMEHPNLEVFLSQVEEGHFKLTDRPMKYSDLRK